MPNTEAESVDDIVAARSSEGMKAKWILVQLMPDSHQMNSPVMRAVSSTPTEESIKPGRITGRIAESLVPRPPENNMTLSATMPMNWAVCISLNCMPRPSVPNNIPTIRNMSSKGSPKR